MDEQRAILVNNVLELIGLSILYYDYILTFPDEVFHIWQRGGYANTSMWWFFLNRYLPFFGNIVVTVLEFQNLSAAGLVVICYPCNRYHLLRQILLFISQIVVFVVMFIRTYALYNRSKRILTFLLTTGSILLSVSIWSMFGQESTFTFQVGCTVGFSRITGIHLAVPFEAQFTMDTIICCLTLYRTWQLSRDRRARAHPATDILSLMMRDGALYFGVMALANMSNIATFYAKEPLLRGSLSTFAGAVSVTMCSRMILNLHSSAYRDRKRTHTTTPAAATTAGNAQFTTRFEQSAQWCVFDDEWDDGSMREPSRHDPMFFGSTPETWSERDIGMDDLSARRWEGRPH